MSKHPVAAEPETRRLLRLADIPQSDQKAAAWLTAALVGARGSDRAARQRPLVADHNDRLATLAKSAKTLRLQLQRLQAQPYTWDAFWQSVEPVVARVHRVAADATLTGVLKPARPPGDREVLAILNSIERAARRAKLRQMGRPRELATQHVVDLAFAFFVRYSPIPPSGTPSGRFATFARAFYAEALNLDPDDDDKGELNRQIRTAARRKSIEQARTTQRRGTS
jgi:hypothetical protein